MTNPDFANGCIFFILILCTCCTKNCHVLHIKLCSVNKKNISHRNYVGTKIIRVTKECAVVKKKYASSKRQNHAGYICLVMYRKRIHAGKKLLIFGGMARHTPLLESLFTWNCRLKTSKIIAKGNPAQAVSCEFWEIFKNTYLVEHISTFITMIILFIILW